MISTLSPASLNMKKLLIFLILLFPYTISAGPLHDAVLTDNLEKIEQLLANGEKINEINKEGVWPLLIASTYGFEKATELLINKGANVNQANQYGYTALHEAASMGYIKIVKVLVKNKADVNKKDVNSYSALKYAQSSGTPMVVRYLKRHGAVE